MEGNKRTGSSGMPHPLSRSAVQLEAQDHFNFVAVIDINPGEDVGERIKSYLENRVNFPSWVKEHSCRGCILSVQGAVRRPIVDKPDKMILYKGSCNLSGLSGFYLIPIDGPVQLGPYGALTMTGNTANGILFEGSVSGKLYADTPVQVRVHVYVMDEDPEGLNLCQNN